MSPQRTCPTCGTIMRRLPSDNRDDFSGNVWDLGVTGPGITGTDTTSATPSGSPYFSTSGEDFRRLEPREVLLIPYECPNCHYKESFRE